MRLLLAILLLLAAAPVQAQQGLSQAMVVSSCGGGSAPSGALTNLTMDTTGKLCLGGTFGIASVWSAADAAATGMTLSNGGLTVTASGGSGAWTTTRISTSKTSGKLYLEFHLNTVIAGPSIMFGMANAGFNVSVANSYLGSAAYSVGLQHSGTTIVSAGFVANYGTIPSAAANDVFALAIDFTAGSIWLAKNNVWMNSSNPATGSLPVVSFTPATVGALFGAMSLQLSGSQTATLQATTASQAYAAPSGFSAWDAP
jgi:hypothetical protein